MASKRNYKIFVLSFLSCLLSYSINAQLDTIPSSNENAFFNIAFMGGLTLGRLVSLALDGVPGICFLIGLVLESVLAIWGLINLKKYGTG
jgi:hypothetical protein